METTPRAPPTLRSGGTHLHRPSGNVPYLLQPPAFLSGSSSPVAPPSLGKCQVLPMFTCTTFLIVAPLFSAPEPRMTTWWK